MADDHWAYGFEIGPRAGERGEQCTLAAMNSVGNSAGDRVLLAHGIGSRSDIPLPTSLAALGAGLALVISFVVLAALWRRPRFGRPDAGRALSGPVQALADSPALRLALQAAMTGLVALICVAGLAGPAEPADNLAPWVFYVTFWVGLVPASLLLGPVWRVVNPLRLLHAGLARLLRLDPDAGRLRLPEAGRYYPAAAALLGFAWFELVHPLGAAADVVWFVLAYAAVQVGAALAFGRGWFGYGDGFEVYSTLLGALAPLGRRPDGTLVLRNPLDGLAMVPTAPGLTWVVVVLIGATAFDGVSGTLWWQTTVPTVGVVNGTLGLLIMVGLIAAIYALGTWGLVARDAFAHSLVPIAAGYALAHYFSSLVLDGQQAVILASDPFDAGADLLGTASMQVDYALIGATVLGLVQIGAVVTGHLLAAVGAHDRAVALFAPRVALRAQYPLLAAMVALTVGAIGLLFAA